MTGSTSACDLIPLSTKKPARVAERKISNTLSGHILLANELTKIDGEEEEDKAASPPYFSKKRD